MKKIVTAYHFFLTLILLRPFFKYAGKKIIIRNSILITPASMSVGSRVQIRDFSRIEGIRLYSGVSFKPSIEIGDDVFIEQNLHLTCAKRISIGKNTAVASNVTITDIEHGYEDVTVPPERQPLRIKEVLIGDNCKIYNNAVILPGTKLGNHNIVGANSVVSGSYPDYCVIVGAPSRIVKEYDFTQKKWVKTKTDVVDYRL
jgi:acetyltransferase-like isoleucine patch superfamily enzyme